MFEKSHFEVCSALWESADCYLNDAHLILGNDYLRCLFFIGEKSLKHSFPCPLAFSQLTVSQSAFKEPSVCDGNFLRSQSRYLHVRFSWRRDEACYPHASPGEEFGCEMFSSSPVCDNIWSVRVLEAVSSPTSASCRRQRPPSLCQVNTGSRSSTHSFTGHHWVCSLQF